MESLKRYGTLKTIRLFDREAQKISKIVTHAKDMNGFPKYDNESHFIRCAATKLVREEYPALKIKRGRPKNAKKS